MTRPDDLPPATWGQTRRYRETDRTARMLRVGFEDAASLLAYNVAGVIGSQALLSDVRGHSLSNPAARRRIPLVSYGFVVAGAQALELPKGVLPPIEPFAPTGIVVNINSANDFGAIGLHLLTEPTGSAALIQIEDRPELQWWVTPGETVVDEGEIGTGRTFESDLETTGDSDVYYVPLAEHNLILHGVATAIADSLGGAHFTPTPVAVPSILLG